MNKKTNKKLPKKDYISVLFGWAYIAVAISLIIMLLVNAQPEGKLVCDKSARGKPLIGFGACREEPVVETRP